MDSLRDGGGALATVMRGLELAHKLQQELTCTSGGSEKPASHDSEALLARLHKIVASLNDGIRLLRSSPALQGNAPPPKQRICPIDKSHTEPADRRRERKRCLPKTTFRLLQEDMEAFDDHHTWRKYGQKMILGKKHPRSYYRCSHSVDLGCPAIKQVQRCDDGTCGLDLTYIRKHTCQQQTCAGSPHIKNSPLHSPLKSISSVTTSSSPPSTQELTTTTDDYPFKEESTLLSPSGDQMEEELHFNSFPFPMKGSPYSSFQDVFSSPTTFAAVTTSSLVVGGVVAENNEAIEQCEESNLMLIFNPLPSCSSSLHPFELQEHVCAFLDYYERQP